MFDSMIVVLVIVVVTFLSRALPFMIFNSKRNAPSFLHYLGKVLPNAIVGMLIVYCLKGMDISSFPFGANEVLALGCVIVLQFLFKLPILSIVAGTGLYMYLVQSEVLASLFHF